MLMKSTHHQRGVSLIEVLISLLVIAVGILGLAKMQALSIANTQVSGTRGIVAMQANSLAAIMHSNSSFWGSSGAVTQCGSGCTLTGTSTTLLGVTAPPLSSCQGSTATANCTGVYMAALDLNTWMANMAVQVPNYTAIITCAADVNGYYNCTAEITWFEKSAGMNSTTAAIAAANAQTQQAFYIYVQP